MAKKGRAGNRRKPSPGGRRPLVALLVVAILIALALFLLEKSRKEPAPAPPKVAAPAPATSHLPLPEHEKPVQQTLSTARVPAPKPHAAALPKAHGPGRVAVIIDDMGSSLQELQTLQSIGLPITYSIIPSLPRARQVADSAHAAGAEVMVHMPMEPEGYPKQKMESIGLLITMDDAEIAKRVSDYFSRVPHAVGANNHMGSRFTQHADKMEAALGVLKEKGVFFIDSRTSPASVGYQTARALGIRAGTRQVFLDNVQDEGAIGKQLFEAATIARKRRGAIAICHPHPATLRALKAYLPELAKTGITFVYASALTS